MVCIMEGIHVGNKKLKLQIQLQNNLELALLLPLMHSLVNVNQQGSGKQFCNKCNQRIRDSFVSYVFSFIFIKVLYHVCQILHILIVQA